MNPVIDFRDLKKHLIALLSIVAIILLFLKWVSLWGMSFGLLELAEEMDEPIYMIGLIVCVVACLYSLIRAETRGRKFELLIGFVLTAVYTVVFLVEINEANHSDGINWGAFGFQLSGVPTAELIICVIGAAISLMGKNERSAGKGKDTGTGAVDFSAIGKKLAGTGKEIADRAKAQVGKSSDSRHRTDISSKSDRQPQTDMGTHSSSTQIENNVKTRGFSVPDDLD